MKPLNLKMRAFGPYVKPVEIDFANGLAGSNFFLIHGATGAGKTTILDAICYALYNTCSGEKRTGEMMRSEKAARTDKTEVDFTFELNGKIYRVIRSPKYWRKSLRGDGLVEEKANVEIYVDGKLINVDKDVSYFQNLLQFSADQFRQVVLLPQGEFRKFLMANSAGRSEILNVIFNANLYKLIEVKLKEKYQAVKSDFDNLTALRKNFLDEAKSIGNVDSDTFNEDSIKELIEKLTADLKTFDAEISKLQVLAETAATNLSDGKILYADFEAFDKSAQNLKDIKSSLESVEKNFTAVQVAYEARKAEEARRRELERAIDDISNIQRYLSELDATKIKLEAAEKSEKTAKLCLKKLENNKVAYEARLNELKKLTEKLSNADVKFNEAKQTLERAQERQSQIDELNRLKEALNIANNRLETSKKNFDAAQLELNRLIALQKLGAAAKLASTLQDGEPCPVCGSINHPHLAVSEGIIPDDDDVALAENIVKRRQMERDSAVKSLAKITGNVDAVNEAVKKLDDALTLENAKKNFEDAKKFVSDLELARKNLKKGEELTNKLYIELEEARKTFEGFFKMAENLRGVVAEKQSQIPDEYLLQAEKISDDLRKFQLEKSKLDDALATAEKKFQQALNQKSKLEGSVRVAEKVHEDATKKIYGKVKPDVKDLKLRADSAQKNHLNKILSVNQFRENLKNLKKIDLKLQSLSKEINDLSKESIMWNKLSDTASGKLSFQRYYLNAMFQHVINEANLRLEKMSSGRYNFHNKDIKDGRRVVGLDLEIFDAQSGTCRDVATLSGGESFLASLSLALGLAAVVKNTAGGIQLDAIFIDEGFGSLDSETLDYAINTLIDLQGDGRLVGIISHIEELKQRIPNRLEIIKHRDGSTARFIS